MCKDAAHTNSLRLAELMRCPHDSQNIGPTIECLRTAPASELVDKEWYGITDGLIISIFVPINDGQFLEDEPSTLVKNGMFKKANIMMGSNRDEGMFHIFYHLPELFEKEEHVYISREDFKHSVEELNINKTPLQRKGG